MFIRKSKVKEYIEELVKDEVRSMVKSEVHDRVKDYFTENNVSIDKVAEDYIYRNIKDVVSDRIDSYAYGEDFIDNIIDRINRKQIK